MFQIGSIGLLKCIDNFDLERKVKFSTYAVPLIMGEIKRFLRDDGLVKVSRSLKEASYKIKREKEHYEKLYNREPTLKEIAATLDMDESDILMAMESGQDVCSLHQVIYQNEGDEIHLEDKLEQQSDLIEQTVDNIYIQELLQKLNEQERKLIELRYFQNQTQAVIAGIMGISQVQVSRMEKKILEKLRMHSLN
jgi:RNA polymerase sporulation-specific sigma factor